MNQKNNVSNVSSSVKDILFIHGITSYGKAHLQIAKHLTKLGYRFHYFDLPGHGNKKWEWNDHKFKFTDMLNFIDDYIKINLKDKPFIIMGHSMGGGIALSTYPKYINQIKAVILECPLTPAIFNRSEEDGEFKIGDLFKNFARVKAIILKGWTKFKVGVCKWLGKDRCFAPLLTNIIKSDALNIISDGIKNIKVPTLLIVGSQDKVIPPIATSKYLSKYIKNITVQTAVSAGHNPFKDTPEQYQEFIIDFLKKVNR